MKTRLASLFLMLVLFGGAFAGVPMSFGESQCSMGGMTDKECCKAMLLQQSRAKFTQEEELLCALNCTQNGTTVPASVVRVIPAAQAIQAPQAALTQARPFALPLSIAND